MFGIIDIDTRKLLSQHATLEAAEKYAKKKNRVWIVVLYEIRRGEYPKIGRVLRRYQYLVK